MKITPAFLLCATAVFLGNALHGQTETSLLPSLPSEVAGQFQLSEGASVSVVDRGGRSVFVVSRAGDPALKRRVEEYRRKLSGEEKTDAWIINELGEDGANTEAMLVIELPDDARNLRVTVDMRATDKNAHHLVGVVGITHMVDDKQTKYRARLEFWKEGGKQTWSDYQRQLARGQWFSRDIVIQLPEGGRRIAVLYLAEERQDVAKPLQFELQNVNILTTTAPPNTILVRQ